MSNSSPDKIIIGVDPGTTVTGYGILKKQGNLIIALDYGCIRPPAKLKLSDRYLIIYESLLQLIEKHQPDALVVESQFVKLNAQTAIKLGMAKGTAILAAKSRGVAVFEYSPRKAKQAVVGNGAATKNQVQWMMQKLLNLAVLPEPQDASDALALALCHINASNVLYRPPQEI